MNKAAELEEISSEVHACNKCRLWKTRRNTVPGEGPANAKIMFIGEAPGKQEDSTGRPFVGRSGKFLNYLLSCFEIKRSKVFITSPLKCYPGPRKPKRDELAACRPYLERQLAIIKPKLIVLLGDVALKWFFPRLKLKEVHGKKFSWKDAACIPTFHPAAGMRFPKARREMLKHFKKISSEARRYM